MVILREEQANAYASVVSTFSLESVAFRKLSLINITSMFSKRSSPGLQFHTNFSWNETWYLTVYFFPNSQTFIQAVTSNRLLTKVTGRKVREELKSECLEISSNPGGHSQTLFFAKIWFVDGYHCLNKCDIIRSLKYRLNFEKKVENLFRLLAASIRHKMEANLVAPKICTACEQGIKVLKISCNVLIKETF